MSEPAKILVIDDNEDDRFLYRRCLRKSTGTPYTVSEAVSGEEGLAQLETDTFDSVLLDYSLPGRNGIEILKRIRAKHLFVPVVMLTGHGSEKVAVTAMQEGAQNYISKGTITPEALENTIQVAIQHCALQKRIADQRGSLEIFAWALAHDLKEPVRSIRSLLDVISSEGLFAERTESHLRSIQNSAERMYALIDAVHFYTRLDGTEKADRVTCDASELVRAAMENLNRLIQERQAVIAYGDLPQIHFNRTQGIQVFQNLLHNAIQHCTSVPRIDIAVEETPDHWVFRVSDNGPGIGQQDAETIFKPFKRMSRHDTQGLGLGLAICKRIMELHGGKIWCESKLGQGATFYFSVPKVALQAVTTVSADIRSPVIALENRNRELATLLLVEDNEIDIELTQIFLIERNRMRCNLLVARDGYEALEQMLVHDVDLMLLDINMPRMDGFELLERMRVEKLLDRVGVIMCSTSTYKDDILRAANLGARGYLTKPPDFARLKSVVDNDTDLQLVEAHGSLLLLRPAS